MYLPVLASSPTEFVASMIEHGGVKMFFVEFSGGGRCRFVTTHPLPPECFRVVIPPARVWRSWFGNLVDLKWHQLP